MVGQLEELPEEDDEWDDEVYDGKTGQLLRP